MTYYSGVEGLNFWSFIRGHDHAFRFRSGCFGVGIHRGLAE